MKATITGDFAIPGTGATSGPIAVLVDSDQGSGVGSKNNTATDRAVFTFQFPQATVLTGIEINVSAADVIRTATTMRVEASNDGMNYTPVSVDYVLGSNLSSGAPQYGGTAAVAYTLPFANNQTEYTYYRVFAPTMRTNFGRSFNEIYFDYEFFDPQVDNLGCDNSTTLFEFDDDKVVFTMNPTPGSGSYSVAIAGGFTISPTTATYGAETTFTVSEGSADAGDLTVTLTDAAVPCSQEITIPNATNACIPGPCGEPNWNDPAMKATIAGDFAIPGTGATSGPIAVLVDSDQGSGVGSKNNTATDRAVFTFQFPQATVLTGIEINVSAADVIRTATTMRVEASNDGMNYTPVSIDYVLGTNLASGAPQYGGTAAVAYTLPFTSNQTEYTYYRVFAPTMRTNFGRSFNEIYFDYEFFDPMVTNITCDNNSTLFEFSDDGVVFTMNPGPGTGTYDISLVGSTHSITPTTATYGAETTFTISNGSAGTGDLTVRLIDASVPCVQEFTIPNETNACIPGTCGTLDWNQTAIKQTITLSATANTSGNIDVLKDGNDNNNNFFYPDVSIVDKEVLRVQFTEPAVIRGLEYVIGNSWMYNTGATTKVQGSTDGSTWVDMVPNATGTSPSLVITGSTYVKDRGLGNNHPGVITSATSAETYFWDNTTSYLYYRILGVSGNTNQNPWVNEIYFDYDIYDAQVGNISFGDNGTPGAPNDDKLLFELNPAPGTGTYSVQITGYTVTPATATYGAATSFEVSSGSAGIGDLTALIIDESVPCVQEVTIPNPNIDLSVVASQATCISPSDNPLGSITISGEDGEIAKAGQSAGTTYSGPNFGAATTVSNLPAGVVLVNNLPNPTSFTNYYTVRGYFSETLFKDYVVSLERKPCSVTNLSVAVSTLDDEANEGELLVYDVALTNNGPDPAVNVEIKVDIPTGLDLVTASTPMVNSAPLGEYSAGTQLWTIPLVPLGTHTLKVTYRMK